MDIQALFDTISKVSRDERQRYHMSLGDLIAALDEAPESWRVETPERVGIGRPHSYRGYYEDLAFQPEATAPSVADARAMARECLGKTFEGYKGGDFQMSDKTALWISGYGDSSGLAIVGASHDPGNQRVLLTIKQVD